MFIFALLKTTDQREFFFNCSYIKFVFNFQFEKSLIKLVLLLLFFIYVPCQLDQKIESLIPAFNQSEWSVLKLLNIEEIAYIFNGPAKRIQHVHATSSNTDESNVLHSFGHYVARCWMTLDELDEV